MSEKIRVTVVGTRGFPGVQGGVEEHCKNLYTHLSAMGCEITVFTREPYTGKGNKKYKGVTLVSVPCPKKKSFEAIIHTFKCIFLSKRYTPDIVHFHAIGPSILVPLARLLGMKTVMTNHGPDYDRAKWGVFAKMILHLGECLGSLFSNEVICISEPIAESIEKKFNRKTDIIPNGVEIPVRSENTELIDKLSLKKEKYILAVGRFVPEKGFKDLIEAFLSQDLEEWKLVIVGDADHKNRYSCDIEERAVKEKNIILTGFLTGDALKEIYSHAGLFVLPSYHEGLPIVLLEAMSYGIKCLASNIPANICVGLPDSNYFKVGDIDELAFRLKEYTNSTLRPEGKEQQIDFLKEKYNWKKIAMSTLEVYKGIV